MILGRVRDIEVEYDEDYRSLFLTKGEETYELNIIVVWDKEEAEKLIQFLNEFIKIKENECEVI